MAHREGIREWLKDVDLTNKDVIDWGCGTKPIKNYLSGAKSYFGIDILPHVGADLVADICNLELGYDLVINNKIFDVAFCLEVLEHTKSVENTLSNIYRSLTKGGKLYLSVPFLYPIHSDHDLWRFTDQGIKYLLELHAFKDIKIKSSTNDQQGWLVEATV
jgi:SAM-dependent methyltransferase